MESETQLETQVKQQPSSVEKGEELSGVGVNGSFETDPIDGFVGGTDLNDGTSDGVDGDSVGVDVGVVEKSDSLAPEVEKNDILPSGVEENDTLASGVVVEEGSVGSGVEKNDVLPSGVEENDTLASGVVEEEGSVASGVEKNDPLTSGVVEEEGSVASRVEKNGFLASGVVEEEGSVALRVEKNDSLACRVVDEDGSVVSVVENNDGLASGVVEEEGSVVSGVEKNDSLASGFVEEEGSVASGAENNDSLASGVVEEEGSVVSGVEKNDSLASRVEEDGSVASGVENNDSLASGVVEEEGSVAAGVENNDSLASGVVEEEGSVVSRVEKEDSLPFEVEENAALQSGVVEDDGGVELGNEGDAVVDSINVDVGEVVRSGVAVVGVEERGESTEIDSKGVEEEEMQPLINENGSVDESSVLDVDERKNPAVDVEQSSPVEEPKASVPEPDWMKSTGEEDSVIDEIHVDPVEAVRSGIAVVGDSKGEKTDVEVKEVETSVGENVKLENEFEPLVDANEDPVTDSNTDQVKQKDNVKPDIDETAHEEASERGFVPQEGVESQILTEPEEEEEADSDAEGDEKEMFDSAAFAALLKAATSAGSDSSTITITPQEASRLFSVERPAGLGSSLPPLRPATRPSNSSLVNQPHLAGSASEENLSDEERNKLQQMHQLRIKFLRLVQRLGSSEDDSIAAQVLYRLALLAGRPTSPAFSLENTKQTAVQLETQGKDDLDFSLTVLVLGKTGVGKSATINSIFGEEKVKISAFEPETTTVQEVSGIIDGVKIRVIDVPGLRSSGMDQGFNRKILASVKKFMKKYPPDIMLYVDRLDTQTRDLNDLPVLRTITSSLGSSIWRSAIVALTHAASAPPDGPSGSPLSYEVFVANRSHIVQQFIGQAAGDLRLMNPSLMNPVSLVENHPACRKNRDGQRVLPNGQAWRPQLLLLSYSLKILSEANASLKPQDPFDHRKLFGFRVRSAPLPYLLSTMLQPHAHPKLPADQGGDNVDSDVDLDDLSDSDQEEEEDEYDQLPPFKPLRKSQIAKLSRDQRKAYFEEYDYRVKLLQRKQWRQELKRMREIKKGKSDTPGYGDNPDEYDADNDAPAAVPVPLPDMVLPPSFDSDNPAYRYRFLEPTSQFLARPVLDTHGWDHDCGYDGVNVEQSLGIAGRFPASVTVQVTKDKKECNIHLDSALSAKHGEHGSSLVGFDIQTIGKQPAYTIRGETKSKLMKNKAGAGVAVTILGENVATGVKFEDHFNLGKRLVLLGSAGTVRSQKDAAYGANMELRLREADYPIGQDQSSLNLSLMKWRGDLAIGGNLQSQISVGRNSKMAVRVSLNNKLSGQISVKTSSSDHLQLALAGLVPIVLSIYNKFKPSVSDSYSPY